MMRFAQTCLGLVAAASVGLLAHTEAAIPRQDFNRLLQELQSLAPAADDFALRETLLLSVRSLDTTPATPPEAARLLLRARAMIEMARDDADIEAAADELHKAVRLAPWVPELAYNLAVVRELQGYYSSAAKNLKLYLLSSPDDSEAVTEKIVLLEVNYERDMLAAASERCGLMAERTACDALLILSIKQPDHRLSYGAVGLVCRRVRQCGPEGAMLLGKVLGEYLEPDDVVGADTGREAVRAVALIFDDCRSNPSTCGSLFTGILMEARKQEFKRKNKTVFIDTAFASAGTTLQCPTTPADCMVEGLLTQFGVGRKRDDGAAKRLYETACKANIEEGCRLRRAMGR